VLALFSKVSKKAKQGQLLGYFASAGSLARVIFPILSAYISQTCKHFLMPFVRF
jgi:ceroid-lipofuscinosis MFS transporter 7